MSDPSEKVVRCLDFIQGERLSTEEHAQLTAELIGQGLRMTFEPVLQAIRDVLSDDDSTD